MSHPVRSEEFFEKLRLERNRLLDKNCLCDVGRFGSRTFVTGPLKVFYNKDCPLTSQHQPPFLNTIFEDDLDQVNKRWPYKDEPVEKKPAVPKKN